MPTKTKTETASAAPEVREVEQALAEEKANQEQIGATVQAAKGESFRDSHVRALEKQVIEYALERDTLQAQCRDFAEHAVRAERERDALQAQRDELLAACKYLLDYHSSIDAAAFYSARLQAKAAIARATEGGKGQ